LPKAGKGSLVSVYCGEECARVACQGHAFARKVTGARIAAGETSAWGTSRAQQHGDFLYVDLVVFGFPAMDGLHGKDDNTKRESRGQPEVCQPVPGKHACGREDDLIGRE